jgi:hypothetical protein
VWLIDERWLVLLLALVWWWLEERLACLVSFAVFGWLAPLWAIIFALKSAWLSGWFLCPFV